MMKVCPECGEKVTHVTMTLDQPMPWAEPCGHFVRYNHDTHSITTCYLSGQKVSRS